MKKLSLILILAGTSFGQTSIPVQGTLTLNGVLDAGSATSTTPAKKGTSLPATCSVGDQYFKTDASAGSNLYGCTATNTWTVQAGGGEGAVSSVNGQTGAVTIDGARLADNACTVTANTITVSTGTWRFDNQVYTLASDVVFTRQTGTAITAATNASPIVLTVASTLGLHNGDTIRVTGALGNTAANGTWPILVTSTTITLQGSTGNGTYTGSGTVSSAGSGAWYAYANQSGQIQLETSSSGELWVTLPTGAGIHNQVLTPSVPSGNIPVCHGTITSGAFVTTFVNDHTPFTGISIVSGLGMNVVKNGGSFEFNVDSTVGRQTGNNVWTGANDFTNATRTAPCRLNAGAPTGQPGTVGDCVINTSGTPGQNIYIATTTGTPATWSPQGGAATGKSIVTKTFPTANETSGSTTSFSGGWSSGTGTLALTSGGTAGTDRMTGISFPDAATNTINNAFILDSAYDSGNFVFSVAGWGATSTAGVVRLSVGIECIANGVDAAATFAGSQNLDITLTSQGTAFNYVGSVSSLAGTGTCAPGELAKIRVQRLGSDAADTFGGAFILRTVEVRYLANLQ